MSCFRCMLQVRVKTGKTFYVVHAGMLVIKVNMIKLFMIAIEYFASICALMNYYQNLNPPTGFCAP